MRELICSSTLPIANCQSPISWSVTASQAMLLILQRLFISLSLSLSLSIYIYICVCVWTRAQIYILGLKPYLVTWIRPRRNKRLDKLQNRVSHTEKVEEGSLRRLSFSNRVNVGQASSWAI